MRDNGKDLVALAQHFLKPVFYALVLIIQLFIFIAQQVLSNITYRVALNWLMFASGIVILVIAILIVVLPRMARCQGKSIA